MGASLVRERLGDMARKPLGYTWGTRLRAWLEIRAYFVEKCQSFRRRGINGGLLLWEGTAGEQAL